jgi:hypothetical protein
MANYIGHYKCVESPEEFYSSPRTTLDFPTQVMHKSKNYILNTTLQYSTSSQEDSINRIAKERNIDFGIEV